MNLVDVTAAYLHAGLCAIPARADQKRPTLAIWKTYQTRLPTEIETVRWFEKAQAVCLICGAVSGNLEMLDFDLAGEAFEPWWNAIQSANPGLLDRLVIEQSPSGGWHVVYRCEKGADRSLKLAQRKQPVDGPETVIFAGKPYQPRKDADGTWYVILTLIETRGEGGLFLCAPSPGYELVQGDFTELPIVTDAERELLLSAAWQLNEYMPDPAPPPTASTTTAPDGRPGDDFNKRGDVREILRRHGWALAQGGENEYWRRPGKTSGWSATFKDNVFYVFSSSAAPFEPNQAYSPFSVYAWLEHGGDFAMAASALRSQGYGEDVQPDTDVDLSHLLSHNQHEEAIPEAFNIVDDPGPIPEHFFHVPGFIAQVMEFTLTNAPYPNIGLAFCGALALQSFLCSRRVATPGDLRPNLYLLALAGSGTGKDFPRKVNTRILFETGLIAGLGDKFASGEGIQDALIRSNAMLFQNDEMDGVLRQINLDRENRRESIPNILLTLYTSANDVYPVRVKAGQKEAIHIDQPHLTLFGTATPEYFYESLSQRMLTNGFFARLVIVDIGKRGTGQVAGSARHLPEEILAKARWWADFQPGRQRGNLQALHPEPRVVPFDTEATRALTRLQRMAETEYDAADQRKDEVGRVAWSRTCENAGKLALLYACSENHENPVIGSTAIQWAAAFAMHQTRRPFPVLIRMCWPMRLAPVVRSHLPE